MGAGLARAYGYPQGGEAPASAPVAAPEEEGVDEDAFVRRHAHLLAPTAAERAAERGRQAADWFGRLPPAVRFLVFALLVVAVVCVWAMFPQTVRNVKRDVPLMIQLLATLLLAGFALLARLRVQSLAS